MHSPLHERHGPFTEGSVQATPMRQRKCCPDSLGNEVHRGNQNSKAHTSDAKIMYVTGKGPYWVSGHQSNGQGCFRFLWPSMRQIMIGSCFIKTLPLPTQTSSQHRPCAYSWLTPPVRDQLVLLPPARSQSASLPSLSYLNRSKRSQLSLLYMLQLSNALPTRWGPYIVSAQRSWEPSCQMH